MRAVVHLHGAKAPPESDGYPENWYVPGKSAMCHYPNHQDATMLWYHDHTLGINRLNVFAGLFGVFLVRDEFEDSLNLPRGKYEIPLAIYDRVFDLDGQLNYPVSDNPKSPWVPEVFGDAILVNGKLFPLLGSGTAQVSFPRAQRSEWQILPFDAVQRSDVQRGLSADRHRSGTAARARSLAAFVNSSR